MAFKALLSIVTLFATLHITSGTLPIFMVVITIDEGVPYYPHSRTHPPRDVP